MKNVTPVAVKYATHNGGIVYCSGWNSGKMLHVKRVPGGAFYCKYNLSRAEKSTDDAMWSRPTRTRNKGAAPPCTNYTAGVGWTSSDSVSSIVVETVHSMWQYDAVEPTVTKRVCDAAAAAAVVADKPASRQSACIRIHRLHCITLLLRQSLCRRGRTCRTGPHTHDLSRPNNQNESAFMYPVHRSLWSTYSCAECKKIMVSIID